MAKSPFYLRPMITQNRKNARPNKRKPPANAQEAKFQFIELFGIAQKGFSLGRSLKRTDSHACCAGSE